MAEAALKSSASASLIAATTTMTRKMKMTKIQMAFNTMVEIRRKDEKSVALVITV